LAVFVARTPDLQCDADETLSTLAIRVGLLTNTTPESWLGGQPKWDLWQVSQKPLPAVAPFRRAA